MLYKKYRISPCTTCLIRNIHSHVSGYGPDWFVKIVVNHDIDIKNKFWIFSDQNDQSKTSKPKLENPVKLSIYPAVGWGEGIMPLWYETKPSRPGLELSSSAASSMWVTVPTHTYCVHQHMNMLCVWVYTHAYLRVYIIYNT